MRAIIYARNSRADSGLWKFLREAGNLDERRINQSENRHGAQAWME